MNFKYPFFLYFILLSIIPVIIHFINFRKHKKILFSNVKLLQAIKHKKSSYNKLKDIILMLTRMLAISLLAISFAQPFFEKENVISTENDIVMYIDNSPSMNNTIKKVSLLEIAKNQALKLKDNAKQNIFLINNQDNFAKKVSKSEFENKISEINISYTDYNFQSIMSKIKNNNTIKNPIIYVMSDFQTNAFNSQYLLKDSILNIEYIQILGDQNDNISVDSCWTDPQINVNENNILYVKITNHGNYDKNKIPISLFLNNKLNSIDNISIKSNQTEIAEINFSTNKYGWNYGNIKINDHPITHDDEMYFSFNIENKKQILNIYDDQENKYLYKIFKDDDVIKYESQNINQLNYNSFQKYNVIVLNEIQNLNNSIIENITQYISQNKTVVILPNKNANIESYNQLLRKINIEQITDINYNDNNIKKLNLQSNIYKNVFTSDRDGLIEYPTINQYYKTQRSSKVVKEDLIILENEEAFMSKYFYENGEIYFFKSGLSDDFGNFNTNAMIVPTFYNIVLYSFKNKNIYYNLSNNLTLNVNYIENKNQKFEISNFNNNKVFIPRITNTSNVTKFETLNQITENGHYVIKGLDTVLVFSVNYTNSESNQEYLDAKSLKNEINFQSIKENTSLKKGDIKTQQPLWKYCIMIIIMCLFLEFILIRL